MRLIDRYNTTKIIFLPIASYSHALLQGATKEKVRPMLHLQSLLPEGNTLMECEPGDKSSVRYGCSLPNNQ